MLTIRNETEADYAAVENLTRKAFYNVYVPGCMEHYLVRVMREHEDFVPELDFVAELDGEIVGNIMYTKACLTDEQGTEKTDMPWRPSTTGWLMRPRIRPCCTMPRQLSAS